MSVADPETPASHPHWRDVVGWTVPLAMEQLDPFNLVIEPRPPQFREAIFGEGKQKTRIQSDGWVDESCRLNVKYSRIQSAVADIATIMIYPTAGPDLLPIFAAEWVVIGPRCHALILDVETANRQPTLFSQMESAYSELGASWQKTIPENRDRPAWFDEIATPWAIYGTADLEILPEVQKAFSAYLGVTIETFYRPFLSQAAGGSDHPDVTAYKQHHYENSPGRPLLSAKAGAAWTDEFLANWHFGPSLREGAS
ncbi:MAG: hypothetical protein SynsKO_35980 [Synoicihabitans sp.]